MGTGGMSNIRHCVSCNCIRQGSLCCRFITDKRSFIDSPKRINNDSARLACIFLWTKSALDTIIPNMDTKRLDEIKEKLKESLEPQLRASLLLEIAAEAWKTSSYTEGKTFAEAALELGVNLADESIQARASHLIGTFYAYLDDYDAALDYYLRAQVLNHRIANAIWEAECFNSMGDIFIRLGNLPKAKDCFEEAYRLHPDYERSINNLGYLRMMEGKLDEAIGFYRKAIEVAKTNKHTRSIIISHINISDVFCKKGKPNEARLELQEAEKLLQVPNIETPMELNCAMKQNLAMVHDLQNDTQGALAILHEAREMAEQANLQDYLLKTEALLAELNAKVQNWEAAYRAQLAHSKLYRQIVSTRVVQKANSIQSFYARENRFLISMNLTERSSRLATLGILSSGITHELNQPLSAIRISAESILYWLKREEVTLPMNFNQELSHIMQGVGRIESFLRQIRQFWNSGKAAKTEACDLKDIIEQSLGMLSRRVFAAGVALDFEPGEDELPTLILAPVHLQQIIINLLAFCLGVLEESMQKKKILRLNYHHTEGSICLVVEQNGAKITKDMMNQLYNPLSPDTLNAASEMGMAIVKYLCDHYGIRIGTHNAGEFWGFRLHLRTQS